MAADAGAQQILDLLNQPSDQLQEDLLAVNRAEQKASSRPYGVMPQYGFDALADARQYYRNLRVQIDAIETVDTDSKAAVLEGLDELDGTFGAYERGLEFGISEPSIPKLRKAKKRGAQAKKLLNAAAEALSQ